MFLQLFQQQSYLILNLWHRNYCFLQIQMKKQFLSLLALSLLAASVFSAIIVTESIPSIFQIAPNKYVISLEEPDEQSTPSPVKTSAAAIVSSILADKPSIVQLPSVQNSQADETRTRYYTSSADPSLLKRGKVIASSPATEDTVTTSTNSPSGAIDQTVIDVLNQLEAGNSIPSSYTSPTSFLFGTQTESTPTPATTTTTSTSTPAIPPTPTSTTTTTTSIPSSSSKVGVALPPQSTTTTTPSLGLALNQNTVSTSTPSSTTTATPMIIAPLTSGSTKVGVAVPPSPQLTVSAPTIGLAFQRSPTPSITSSIYK